MEIFQTLWTTLITPNVGIIEYFYIPMSIIESIVVMLLFTTILNIKSNFKQKAFYVLTATIVVTVTKLILPHVIVSLVNTVAMFLIIYFVFKTNFLETLLAICIPSVLTVILEMLSSQLFIAVFQMPYTNAANIPIYRITFMLFLYLCMYSLSLLAKRYNFNITLLNNINDKNKKTLILTFALGIVAIGMQLYLTVYYSNLLPLPITLLSILVLFAYFFITTYNLTKTNELEIANQDIENLQLFNKTLSILHDNIRAFKHDFNNIVARNRTDMLPQRIWMD